MTKLVRYAIVKRDVGYPSYQAVCHICSGVSNAWDFRRNAIWAARSHVQTEHPEVLGLPIVKVLNPGPWRAEA